MPGEFSHGLDFYKLHDRHSGEPAFDPDEVKESENETGRNTISAAELMGSELSLRDLSADNPYRDDLQVILSGSEQDSRPGKVEARLDALISTYQDKLISARKRFEKNYSSGKGNTD